MPAYPGAAIDLQVQADGTIKDMVSGNLATIVRNSVKFGVYPDSSGKLPYQPLANKLVAEPYPNGPGYWAAIEPTSTNYVRNSGCESDTNLDGLCDNFTMVTTSTAIPVSSRSLEALQGTYSQRVTYTGVAGDTAKRFRLSAQSATGTFASGETCVASAYVKGSLVGATAYLVLRAMDAGGVETGSLAGPVFQLTSTWKRQALWYGSATNASLPANTSYCRLDIYVDQIDNGDTVDLFVDCVQMEKQKYATSFILNPSNAAGASRAQDVVTFPWALGARPLNEALLVVYGQEWDVTGNKAMIGIRGPASPADRGEVMLYAGNTASVTCQLLADSPATAQWVSRSTLTTGLPKLSPQGAGVRRLGRETRVFNTYAGLTKVDTTLTADLTATPRWFEIGMFRGSGNMHNGLFHRGVYVAQALTDGQMDSALALLKLGLISTKKRRPVLQALGGIVKG